MNRKPLQQKAVDQSENRGISADAESQRQDYQSRKAGALAQHTKTVADILAEAFEQWIAPPVAVNLFGLLYSAQLDQRLAAGFDGSHA